MKNVLSVVRFYLPPLSVYVIQYFADKEIKTKFAPRYN